MDQKILYPTTFPGHTRAVLAEGGVMGGRPPHMRGGAHEPLTRADIEEKFVLNARHGGWDAARATQALALLRTLYDGTMDLSSVGGETGLSLLGGDEIKHGQLVGFCLLPTPL